MKRKLISIAVLAALAISPVLAIGFGYHVIEAKAELDFANGIFPLSVDYQFNFPVPDIVEGSSTEFAFRLNNGLDFRTLRQNPDTGSFYALTGGADYPLDYMTVFDEFNLFYNQGFVDDHITIGLAITGRFENSYERLTFLRDGIGEGLFWKADGTERFSGSSFTGAPELKGNRSVFQTYISALFEADYLDDRMTRRDGFRFSSYFRITGPWMLLNDKSADFIYSSNTVDLAVSFLSFERESGKSWFSIVFDNSTTYRFIMGSKVPVYIQGGNVWGDIAAPNTQHVITNKSSLTFYGPQLTVDTYPALAVFLNLGWSFGKALNSTDSARYNEFVIVYGAEARLMLFNIAQLYWQWGYVTNPVFNEEGGLVSRIGFTLAL